MVCIFCSNETQVTNSRPQKRNNNVWRRRQCQVCHSVFTTIEAIDYSSVFRINVQGDFKPFLTDLLYTEVLLALSDRKNAYMDAREITNNIIKTLSKMPGSPLCKPSDISRVTAAVLQKFDKRAWHRYAAEHPSVAS